MMDRKTIEGNNLLMFKGMSLHREPELLDYILASRLVGNNQLSGGVHGTTDRQSKSFYIVSDVNAQLPR